MDASPVSVAVADQVAIVTLNHPPANALDSATRTGLSTTIDTISDDPMVRVVILTAVGNIFCGGIDLDERQAAAAPGFSNRVYREASNAIDSVSECSKPVIAAINGAAVGAGFILAAACDIIVPSSAAVFGMPEIDVGVVGGASLLQQLFGRSRARRMLFTGALFPAEELYRLGVIEESVPPDRVLDAALELAEEIRLKNPEGIRQAKLAANMLRPPGPSPNARLEQELTMQLARTQGKT
jgi:enoyl-CoA hydratase